MAPPPPRIWQHLTAFGGYAGNYSPCVVLRTAARPELPRGQPRALGEALHLRPHDAGIHRRLPDPSAEAAVAPRDDALASHQLRVAPDALRHQLWVLDVVRLRLDHAGDQHLALRHLHALEQRPLVTVPGVGGLERDAGGARREHEVDDVGQRHVVVMGALVVAPAHVHAQLLGRDARGRVIQRLDVQAGRLPELLEAEPRVLDVPAHHHVPAGELYNHPVAAYALVIGARRLLDGPEGPLVA